MPRYGHITDVFLTNIYQRLAENLPRQVVREGVYVPFSLSFSASGSQTVYTPGSGKRAQVLGFYFYVDVDVVVELRFGTSGYLIAGLPFKGAAAMNLLGLSPPTGAVGESVAVYAGGACTVKGWVCVREV